MSIQAGTCPPTQGCRTPDAEGLSDGAQEARRLERERDADSLSGQWRHALRVLRSDDQPLAAPLLDHPHKNSFSPVAMLDVWDAVARGGPQHAGDCQIRPEKFDVH